MKSIQSILFLAVAALLASCGGGSFQKAKSGLLYKIVSNGKGETLKPGSYVKFNVLVKQKDSVTYNSNGKIPAYNQIDSVGRPYDISEIFPKLKVGDSVVIIQMADSIAKQFGQMPPGLKKGDKITFYIKIIKSFSEINLVQADYLKEIEEVKIREVVELESYIKSKGINAVKTQKGAFVQIISPGEGAKPDSGKQVSIKYTGTDLDGNKFDSNVDSSFQHTEPLKFVIGQPGMIAGFEEAVKQLMKGGKAKAYIPSMLGYGNQGSPPNIKPYQTLVFEVELLDITDAPKQEIPMLPPPQQGGGNQ